MLEVADPVRQRRCTTAYESSCEALFREFAKVVIDVLHEPGVLGRDTPGSSARTRLFGPAGGRGMMCAPAPAQALARSWGTALGVSYQKTVAFSHALVAALADHDQRASQEMLQDAWQSFAGRESGCLGARRRCPNSATTRLVGATPLSRGRCLRA